MSRAQNLTSLETLVVNALGTLKAVDITCISVAHLTSITDIMIICTATSVRHVRALAHHMIITLKTTGIVARSEGEDEGEWVLIDAGDIIVHIMQAKTRAFYNLEGLWQSNDK